MTDIVQSLRLEAGETEKLHPGDSEIQVMRDAAIEIERLRAVLKPFADAWECAVSNSAIVRVLTIRQLGALASIDISGAHYKRAAHVLTSTALDDMPL